ncbi:MAG: hypothetical protein L6437_05845 [Kiritimatiellae bacterium]|nr:hypothetical protein [Kiritimatiellia bacterium]
MNELLKTFMSALLFCCVGGILVGYVLARFSKRFDKRISEIATISGLCILLIFSAWALCLAVGNTGFILHVCNLLIIPFNYIVIFSGGHIYSFVLGAAIQIGLMTLTGWLTWHWVKARSSKTVANKRSDGIGTSAPNHQP